jgi:outer membrane protein OmpA-like peptidoglycan-associated protein
LAAERAAAAAREAQEQARAQQSAEQARLEQERRQQAEAERRAAEQAKHDADLAALRASEEKAQADAARADALAQQQAAQAEAERARLSAQQAEQARAQAENEKMALRERLRQQLSMILETRETQRGLIVNINDVLFDFDKYMLKPGAREKLAKVAGILLAYPGLKVQLEGHTDAIGGDEYNLTLSQNRAYAVRAYMVSQGVPPDTVTAVGFGKAKPVATNDTAAGRQQNRRVEMVVTGEPIGVEPSGPQ